MIALIQRVTQGRVVVAGATVGAIGSGLLALVCAERHDAEPQADALLDKLLAYRVFADDDGKMNRSLRDVAGGLLLVPQFTLAADTMSGTRPSFSPAATPEVGRRLFEYFVVQARERHATVASGQFGAHMQVES
ncbi:MAG: D-aminoacyl-tRNA deacylase, partial [Betaproteobacteria bacterium]